GAVRPPSLHDALPISRADPTAVGSARESAPPSHSQGGALAPGVVVPSAGVRATSAKGTRRKRSRSAKGTVASMPSLVRMPRSERSEEHTSELQSHLNL